MRLAMVCTEKLPVPPVKGGAIQTYIAGVLPYLARRHEVTVVGVADPSLPDCEERDGVRFVRVPRGEEPEEYFHRAASYLASRTWDVVEIFNRPASVPLLAGATPGARRLLSMHNDMFQPERLPSERAEECLRALDQVVAISDYVRHGIASLYPAYAGRMRTIRSGVDLERFRPRWQALGARSAPTILTVTRLSKKKGVHLLLDAMELVRSECPEALLLVVGSRWYGADEEDDYVLQVKERAAELGDAVRLYGYVTYDRIPDFYRTGDLFVCSSQWQEPLARVHYEAMAAGLPIITTDRGGNAEVIEEGGNGLIARPHDSPEAFALLILQLIRDRELRLRLGRRGRELAEAHYGWERVARQLLAVLEGDG
jgi:spore coat protein SA